MSGLYLPNMEMPEDEVIAIYLYPNGKAHIWRKTSAVGEELYAIPATDVREIRRGRWIEINREPVHNSNWERVYWKCSECGIEIHTTRPEYEIQKWRYCVNCGAKMEDEA